MTPDWIEAVVSVVAIFAAAVVIWQQSRELREQRAELKLHREELVLQRQELANSVEIQNRIAETEDIRTYFAQQVSMVRWSYDDEDLRTMGLWPEGGSAFGKQTTYVALWLMLIATTTRSRGLNEVGSRDALMHIFSNPTGLAYWTVRGSFWVDENDFPEFVAIANEIHQNTLDGLTDGDEYYRVVDRMRGVLR